MGRKVIFLDIDGTLTEAGSNVPPASALEAVRGAQKKGNYVFLCTGRNYDMLSPLLKYGFDGVVGCSGGYIECLGKVIFDCPMEDAQRDLAMEVLLKNGVFRTVECADGAYTDDGLTDFLEKHADEGANSEMLRWRRQIEKALNIRPMSEYRGQPVYKLVFMCTDKGQLEEPRRVLENDFNFVVQTLEQFHYINGELINRKFDKGRAVRLVCDYLEIPIEDSVGFGDSMNDLEMMETVGLSICMENGHENIKKAADEICPAVNEDGIYKAFERHGWV